jgi:hypothetical protein
MRRMRHTASCAVGLLMIGCSPGPSTDSLDDWLPLYEVHGPVRYEALGLTPTDTSCARAAGTEIIGDLSARDVTELTSLLAREAPSGFVRMLRGRGRYAEAMTAEYCDAPEQGRGKNILFRREGGRWALKDQADIVE